jgi:putative ABC transport system permease protein
MNGIAQILSVTLLGLRSVPSRFGTSLVVVVGVATVVAVFVSVMAMAVGFERTTSSAGSPTRAVILGSGSSTESGSSLTRANALTIANAPGIRQSGDGDAVVSMEALAFVPVTNLRSGLNAFATLRGVGTQGFALRPEIRIAEGRAFKTGLREAIVGRAAQRQLGGLEVGTAISLPQGDWTIVGAFTSGRDSHESELLTDAETLLTEYRRDTFNSVTVSLQDENAFRTALTTDPTLSVQVMREDVYVNQASQWLRRMLKVVAFGIGGIMAFGTAFGALNTMYAAVSTRAREIATLRALGFGGAAVVISILIEALLLALTGAVLGAALSLWIVHGATISTMSGTSPSQLTFELQVTPAIVALGIAASCLIGAVGGLFAAVRASRIPVATAMRAV